MSEYTLEINDVDIPWSSLYYKRSAPLIETPITAVVPLKQAITGEHKIEILEDGVVQIVGRVHDFGYSRGKGGVFTKVIGSTLMRDAAEFEVLERIPTGGVTLAVQMDVQKIVLGKAVPRLDHGVFDVFAPAGLPFEFGADWESRWKMRDAWLRICQATGWEIYVSPLGLVSFKNTCGVDRGKTPVAVPTTKFQTGENILRWTKPHREDHTMIAGDVKVIGRREGIFQAFGSTGNTEPIRKLFFKDLHSIDTCELAAVKINDDMGNPVITGRFNFIDTGLTYDVYDIVQIVDEEFGIDDDYRVYEHEKWITPEKIYGQLTYTNLINMTGNGPLLINRGTGFLIKGQEALKQVTRTQPGLRDEVRQFKYGGEDVTGYTQFTALGGTITVNKDYGLFQSGVGSGQCILESTDAVMNFANELAIDIRFKISNTADPGVVRRVWMGTWNAVTSKGIYFYLLGFDLDAACSNGIGNLTQLNMIDPLLRETWYRLSAFKRDSKVYFYMDSVFIGSISTDVPVAGTTTTLYANQACPLNPGVNFDLWWDQFELSEKNVAAY